MMDGLKWLHRAGAREKSAEAREAELREKEEAARLLLAAAEERAASLSGTAQARREAGDRTGAAIYYAEAITLLREAGASIELAHVLSQAADVRSEMRDYGVAGTMIEEAMRLYGAFDPPDAHRFADACKVAALNSERRARSSWKQALQLYTEVGVSPGIAEAEEHLGHLEKHLQADGEGTRAG